jgi:uncharacterized protein (DUF427 family)
MKTPGPDHPIALTANPRRVRARAAGHVIADSAEVVTLREADLPPIQYFPREDIETGFLSQAPLVTECPYKGRAIHYSLYIDGELIENAAWSYEDPYPAVEAIRGRIAFYPEKVEIYAVDEDALNATHRHEASTRPA